MARFSILTLNLWNINEPIDLRMRRIISHLRRTAVDVICFQEVSLLHSGWQSDVITSACGYHVFFSPAGTWQNRPEGLAILSRTPAFDTRRVLLPNAANDKERIAQFASVNLGGKAVHIVNTHLAYHLNAGADRLKQALTLVSELENRFDVDRDAIVLCGDLNDTPESPALFTFCCEERVGLHDAWVAKGVCEDHGFTFAHENPWASADLWPGRRIDYILFKGLELIACRLVFREEAKEGIASDHYGVTAEFHVSES
jgi:endonuclease/exonuclease/phosphatase family metal-dependent hydrolase